MESKTKKTTAKKTTKIEKEIVKNDEIIVKNQINYTGILNKIFYCLLVIAILLGLNFILNVVTNTDNTEGTSVAEETSTDDYDVSDFETLNTTDAIAKINKGGTQVVYIGRSTCGYCAKFLPIMEQAQKDLGFKTIYINLEEVTTADQEKLVAYDSSVEEKFGYTPMVIVFKDGKYVDSWVGYAELDSYKAFLNDAGIK